MTSQRESKLQKLRRIMKDHCNKCPEKEYDKCVVCKYYISMNQKLQDIQDSANGGDIEDER